MSIEQKIEQIHAKIDEQVKKFQKSQNTKALQNQIQKHFKQVRQLISNSSDPNSELSTLMVKKEEKTKYILECKKGMQTKQARQTYIKKLTQEIDKIKKKIGDFEKNLASQNKESGKRKKNNYEKIIEFLKYHLQKLEIVKGNLQQNKLYSVENIKVLFEYLGDIFVSQEDTVFQEDIEKSYNTMFVLANIKKQEAEGAEFRETVVEPPKPIVATKPKATTKNEPSPTKQIPKQEPKQQLHTLDIVDMKQGLRLLRIPKTNTGSLISSPSEIAGLLKMIGTSKIAGIVKSINLGDRPSRNELNSKEGEAKQEEPPKTKKGKNTGKEVSSKVVEQPKVVAPVVTKQTKQKSKQKAVLPPVPATTAPAPHVTTAPPTPIVTAPFSPTDQQAKIGRNFYGRLHQSWTNLPKASDFVPLDTYQKKNAKRHIIPRYRMTGLSTYCKLKQEALFLIFYSRRSDYEQYFAAKELKNRHWRYNTKYLNWFRRYGEPSVEMADYEVATYIFFDYVKFSNRKRADFTMKFHQLEDKI